MSHKYIEVDFNNADPDGAIRLHLPLTQKSLANENIDLHDGDKVHISDGEIRAAGIVEFRDGIWVVKINEETIMNVGE